MRSCALCLAAATLVACSSPPRFLDAGSVDFDYGFVLSFASDGTLARTSALIEPSASDRVLHDIPSSASESYLLALLRSDVQASEMSFDETRARDLAVASAHAPVPSNVRAHELRLDALHGLDLTEETVHLLPPGDPPESVDELRLLVPIQVDPCPVSRELVRFGASDELLDATVDLRERPPITPEDARALHDLEILDSDHVVGVSAYALFLFERGRAFEPSERNTFTAHQLAGEGASITAMALDPSVRSDGRRTLWLTLKQTATGLGALWEVAAGPSGVEVVGTATVTKAMSSARDPLTDLEIAPDGSLLLVGNNAYIARWSKGELTELFLPRHLGDFGEVRIEQVLYSGAASTPWLLSLDGGILIEGDFDSGQFLAPYTSLHYADLGALASSPDGEDIWAAGKDAVILRKRVGEDWMPFGLSVPSQLLACASEIQEGPVIRDAIAEVLVAGDLAYILPEGCTGILAVHRGSGCITAVTSSDGATRIGAGLRTIRARDDRIIAAGGWGRVMELVPR